MMQFTAEDIVDGMEGIAYLTDTAGSIVTIGRRHWNAFAAENDGLELLDGKAVIGCNLFDFICGREVRESYRRFFDAIIERQARRARVYCRCDSPTVVRELMITVTPVYCQDAVKGLLWQSSTIGETIRPYFDLFDFGAHRRQAAAGRAWPVLALCSYCQSIRYPVGSAEADGEWIAAADYYRRGGDSHVRISHSVCPACLTAAQNALRA